MTKTQFYITVTLIGLLLTTASILYIQTRQLHNQINAYEKHLLQLKGDVQMNNKMFWNLWLQLRNLTDQIKNESGEII